MHLEFISAGLHTAHHRAAADDAPDVLPPDLAPLDRSFILKPAHGDGAQRQADLTSWAQIQLIRQESPSDKYRPGARDASV
jgi:hypothetical protein